jgi:hypothetical protein
MTVNKLEYHNDTSQAERKAILKNDQRVREEQRASTFHAQAIADVGAELGRFGHLAKSTTVVGSRAGPVYPTQPSTSPWSHDPVPNESPLGYAIDEMEPLGGSAEMAPARPAVEDVEADPPKPLRRRRRI